MSGEGRLNQGGAGLEYAELIIGSNTPCATALDCVRTSILVNCRVLSGIAAGNGEHRVDDGDFLRSLLR